MTKIKGPLADLLEEMKRDDSVARHIARSRDYLREARRELGLAPVLPSDIRRNHREGTSLNEEGV